MDKIIIHIIMLSIIKKFKEEDYEGQRGKSKKRF